MVMRRRRDAGLPTDAEHAMLIEDWQEKARRARVRLESVKQQLDSRLKVGGILVRGSSRGGKAGATGSPDKNPR